MDSCTKKTLKDTLAKLSEKLERKMVGGVQTTDVSFNFVSVIQNKDNLKSYDCTLNDNSIITFTSPDNKSSKIITQILANQPITMKQNGTDGDSFYRINIIYISPSQLQWTTTDGTIITVPATSFIKRSLRNGIAVTINPIKTSK